MVFGKKKISKELEKELIDWVSKALEKGSNMEQINRVLSKKYGKKEIADFLKKNYSIEPKAKPDKKLEQGLDEEKKKKQEADDLDAEMEALKAEATEKESEEVIAPEEIVDEPPEAPTAMPKKEEKQPEEVPIDDMSTYKIELLNQVASINHGIMTLVDRLGKK